MRSVWLVVIVVSLLPALASCGDGGGGSLSPPGGRIAFASDRDGNGEVYVMNADGSGQTNLTNHPAQDGDPWWSPDGEEIAFSSFRDEIPDIYVMTADGSETRRLTDTPAVDGSVRWSADGGRIALFSFHSQGDGFLWVANSDLSDLRPLLAGIHPAGPEVECAGGFPGGWLPDGERIVFRGSNAETGALQICSVKTDGTDIRVIFSEPNTSSGEPAVSPDGSRIAFISDRDGNFEIYVVDVNGKNLRRVTNDAGKDLNPAWSPDGEWIAFASDRNGNFDIYVVRQDGEGLRQLTDDPAEDLRASWVTR